MGNWWFVVEGLGIFVGAFTRAFEGDVENGETVCWDRQEFRRRGQVTRHWQRGARGSSVGLRHAWSISPHLPRLAHDSTFERETDETGRHSNCQDPL